MEKKEPKEPGKVICQNYTLNQWFTHAEKSAAPVAALVASLLSVAPHTAPLWPSNVPIQSPVSPCRNIGFPSENIVGENHKITGINNLG